MRAQRDSLVTWWREALRAPAFQLYAAVVLLLLTARASLLVLGDTWFNVLLGRELIDAGLIRSNTLTMMGWGTPVIDIQWLSHLAFFAAERLGGVGGVALFGAVVTALTLIGGAAAAVHRGATPGRVLLVGVLVLTAIGSQFVLRAQTLALPFLVAVPLLLAHDALAPRRATWWLVPLTLVWANVHGSVLLAPVLAGIAMVARPVDAWRAGHTIDRALVGRDATLMLATACAALVTPYGMDVLDYYRSTLGNTAFRDFVTEWGPLTVRANPGAVVLLLVVGGLLVAEWRTTPAFTLLSLGALCVMAVSAVRHVTPFALSVLVLMPAVADRVLRTTLQFAPDAIMQRVGRVALPLTALAFLVVIPVQASRTQPPPAPGGFEQQLAQVVRPGGCVLVDELQSDRLLYYQPELKGIVSHNVRLETIPLTFLQALGAAYANPRSAQATALWGTFDALVLDRRLHGDVIAVLQRDGRFRTLYGDTRSVSFVRIDTLLSASTCAQRLAQQWT